MDPYNLNGGAEACVCALWGFMRLSLGLIVFLGGALWGASAYAEGCDSLDSNVRWVQLFQELSTQIMNNENDAAFDTAEKLSAICAESPILNYAIARIYRNLNNHSKELFYLQRATMYTEVFAVNPDTMEVLWFERYEAEHPECQKTEKTQKTIEELNKAVLEAQKQKYETQIATERQAFAQIDIYKAFMWSGVAVGATGIVMGVTGGVLMLLNKDSSIDQSKPDHVRIKYIHNVGVGLLSAGIATTVVGAMTAGFGGYLYKRAKSEQNYSFMVSPAGAIFSASF